MERVFSLHRQEFGIPPSVVAEAPGSILLMGNSSDCEPGPVITANSDKRVSVAVSFRNDTFLRFSCHELKESKHSSVINNKYKKEDRWANYAKGILCRFSDRGVDVPGMNISVCGEVTEGTGISYPLAISAATAVGVNRLLDLGLAAEDLADIIYRCEQAYIGESNYGSTVYGMLEGNDGCFTAADFSSGYSESIPFEDPDARIVVTMANVPFISEMTGGAEKKKNISKAVSVINVNRLLADRRLRASDIRSQLVSCSDQVRRYCLHLVGEYRRVEEGAELLRSGRFREFGKLLNRSHESLRDNFEVSCPEIDWLVKRAQETDGAYGAKMLGAAFGGSTVAIMKNDSIVKYRRRLDEYERIFGFRTRLLTCTPSRGARILYSTH